MAPSLRAFGPLPRAHRDPGRPTESCVRRTRGELRGVLSMRYRADIDGLRALAVLPVVLYHARLAGLRGGFVGVDVFFVISGFLICSIIVADIARDDFSILRFYERRCRRILPALFAVFLGTSLLSALLLMPPDLAAFGRSLLSSVCFVSN